MKKKLLLIFSAIALFMVLLLAGIIFYVKANQQQLLAQVKTGLNKHIIGELTIDKISITVFKEFPNLSLTLVHPVIKDSVYRQEVFAAQNVFFRINLLQLLRLKIAANAMVLENGQFFLREDSLGYSNIHIFKIEPRTSTETPDINFELDYLKIENLKIIFSDEKRNRHFSLTAKLINGNVAKGDSAFSIPIEGSVHIDSMLFKADKGSFLVNKDAYVKSELQFDPYQMKMTIQPSVITVDGESYVMKGNFLFSRKPAYLTLYIISPKTNFTKARTILSQQIQDKMKDIDVLSPVDVNVFIRGGVDPDFPPLVDANFKLKDATLKAYGVEINNVTLDGLFMNHVRPDVKNDDPNSAILFDIKSAKVEGVPISANVSVTDLKKLYLELSLTSKPLLTDFNRLVPAGKYRFTAGSADVDVHYKGSLHYYLDSNSTADKYDDTLTGKISVTNGSFVYYVRKLELNKIAADINLDLNNIRINNLSAALNGNDLFLQGNLTSIRKVFAVNGQKMEGKFTLDVPRFDLTKVLLDKDINASKKPADAKQVKQATEALEQITDRIAASINFKSNLFTFRKFAAKNVKGELTLSSKGLLLNAFKLEACKGSIQVDGGLNTSSRVDKLNARVQVKNVDIKEFFKSAENFSQTAIMDSNLNGKLSMEVDFYSPLDKGYVPILDSMDATAHFSFADGKIYNLKQLTDVGKTVFKKRDFKNVSFAEIHTTLLLKKGKLFIRRMEIASSVMRIFVQGRYAFKGITDIAIQFPLNNLGRQEINYVPENIGADAKVGANIILRVHGENNKTKISLDAGAIKRLQKEEADLTKDSL